MDQPDHRNVMKVKPFSDRGEKENLSGEDAPMNEGEETKCIYRFLVHQRMLTLVHLPLDLVLYLQLSSNGL